MRYATCLSFFLMAVLVSLCAAQLTYSTTWGKRGLNSPSEPGCKTSLESALNIIRILQIEVQKLIDCERERKSIPDCLKQIKSAMDEGTPTKPPRGVKQNKESSGLLMSVIRALSNSESDEQREREKKKLEKEYLRSDKWLEELISRHGEELTRVMQVFAKVSSQITTARERMSAVKSNLEECKVLLRCHRDELRKQWLEGIEYKHSLQLLDDIAQLRDVPAQLSQQLARKQYLAATQCLTSALSLSDGQLAGIEALRDVRLDLKNKKTQLCSKLHEELKQHIYILPTSDVFRRQGSGREQGLSPFQRGLNNLRGSKGNRARRKLLDVPRPGGDLDVEYEDECDEIDPQKRAEITFFTVSECLCMLSKMPETIDSIKGQMNSELQEIITRTTRAVIDGSQAIVSNKTDTDNEGKKLLLELLDTILEQFRRVAASHASLLRCVSKTCTKFNVALRLYDMSDVWDKMQAVLQVWLEDYLVAGGNAGETGDTPTFNQSAVDISSYFARRKPARVKKVRLFKFDRSSSSLSASKDSNKNGRVVQTLVCPTDIRNITVVYAPLRRLVEELEQTSPAPCPLHAHLHDCVRDKFLTSYHSKLSMQIEAATKTPDAWKAVTDSGETRKLGLSRPLLQSTVSVEHTVTDLRELMRTLPEFADKLLALLCHLLGNYREVCQAAYRGIVQPESEDKRIFSSAWLKDEDINRFIKSLPNWAELQAHKPTHRHRRLRREETAEEESPEDVRQRNVKEAEILASNIGGGGVHRHELLSDVGQLRKLAQLHESMEWFYAQVHQVALDLKSLRNSDRLKCSIPEQTEQKLFQLVHEFTDLADICLLVLHLEVRVQCFYYLLSKSNSVQMYDSLYQEPDAKVVELSRFLIAVHEAMTTSLQPRKIKFRYSGSLDLPEWSAVKVA